MKKLLLVIATVAMVLPSCKKYDRAIDRIENRLDEIENTQISSLQEQVNAINTTLPQLESTDKELKGYIDNLQSSYNALQQRIEDTNTKIEEVKTSLQGENAALLAKLESLKTDLQNQLSQINNTLNTLQTKDSDLEKRIEELENQVKQLAGMSGSTDWINATFATLEQHNALASEVATIKGQIEAINKSISDLQTRLEDKITNDIAAAVDTLNADIQQKVGEITTSYTDAIANAKTEITAAYTAALSNAIANVESSLKQWVNEQLSGYLTIAAAEAKLAALQSVITQGNVALQEELAKLTKSLEDTEKSITEAYTKAIEDAIATNNGVIDGKIATEIATINARIDEEIATINARISTLEQRVGLVEDKIATIEEQIANITGSIDELQDVCKQLQETISTLEQSGKATAEEIKTLKEQYAALSKMIAELQEYVNNQLVNMTDWAEATFATLEQYSALTTELEAIKALIAANQASNTQALNDAIAACENNMKGWVSEQLEGYCTIAELEGKLAALQRAIAEGDAALQEEIETLTKALADAKKEITDAYTKAINDAINANNGVIDDKIADAISEVNTRIDNEVAALNAKISALEARLKKVEEDIATINEQITNINNSIDALKNADNELKGYIDALTTTANGLQEQLNATNTKIDNLEKELQGDISTAKAEVLAQLNALRTELEGELAQITAAISALQAKDAELEKKITDLQSYVDTELSNAKDWAEATFATLEQYTAIANEVATIKAQINAINTSIADLETRINEKIANDIAAAVATLNNDIQQKVKDITDAYTSAINTAKSEITVAYTAAIERAISTLESSMQSWVNEQLKGYYTIAEIDALLATLAAEFNNKLDAQKAYLEGLINALSEELKQLINENSIAIEALGEKANNLDTTVVNNVNKIAENAAAIAANAQNISNNAQAISANSSNITANSSKIDECKTDIAKNTTLIAENKSAIEALKSSTDAAIAKNSTDIAANAEAIAKNAELIAKNAIAINNNAEAIAQNTADIAQLQQDLATTKNEITEAYKSAIATAISTLDGELRGEIATQVANINTRIDNEIAAVNATIDALTTRVATLESEVDAIQQQIADILQDIANMKDDIANLMKRIQSVTYIPKYSDGKATVIDGVVEMDFQISPKSAVVEIAANWQSILSMKAVYTITRAVSFVDMPIASFEADETNGVITITASAENLSKEFFVGIQEASATLMLSDGNNEISSGYIPLAAYYPKDNEIWYAATEKVSPTNSLGIDIISNEWDAVTGIGKIKFGNTITSLPGASNYDKGVFYNGDNLQSITLPNSIISIGAYTFCDCDNLQSITLGNSVKSIGHNAFSGCKSLQSIEIPDGVTDIAQNTFRNCTSLQSVTIPKQIESIGRFAFEGCSIQNVYITDIATWCKISIEYDENSNNPLTGANLYLNGNLVTDLVIPGDVEQIANYAFRGCASLQNVTVSNGKIGEKAFYNCPNLQQVTIDKGVTSLGFGAFWSCDSLNKVFCKSTTPPGAVLRDNSYWYGFSDTSSDLLIYVPTEAVDTYKARNGWKEFKSKIVAYDFETPPNNEIWYTASAKVEPNKTDVFGANIVSNTYENGKGVIKFDGDVAAIGESAFSGCNSLTTIAIPDSVTEIGHDAFYFCRSLTTITIPDRVSSIGESAFRDCSSLKAFYSKFASEDNRCLIIDSVLNSFAPADLTSYTIPDSVTKIGRCAFWSCQSLTTITIPDSVTSIGVYAFYHCGRLTSINIPVSVTKIESSAFEGCSSLTTITIPDSVTSIGKSTFRSCSSLKAFYGKFASEDNRCLIIDSVLSSFAPADLTAYTIPNSVTKIGMNAFDGCSSLVTITIPDSVMAIEHFAFSVCTNLTSVTIPNSVTKIGEGAFRYCSNLTRVDCISTTPPTAYKYTISSWNTFDGNASGRKIYVPAGSVDAYKEADGWQDYADSIVGYDFDNGNETPPNNEIWYTTSDAKILDIVRYGGFGANAKAHTYENGKGIISFDGDVTSIGDRAISFKSLTSIHLPSSIKSIAGAAFCGTSLTEITIPENVEEVGAIPFYECLSLSKFKGKFASTDGRCLIVNGTVKAFAPAGLTAYTIPECTTIAEGTFADCPNIINITIPKSVSYIENSAFYGCLSLLNVYCEATTPPTAILFNGLWDAFTDNAQGRKIYVPTQSVDAYKTANGWKDFADSIVGYDF